MAFSEYLSSSKELSIGSVDDYGDAKYIRLDQNVPDGYVFDLQNDLVSMGFTDLGTSDGAFGEKTEKTVKQFQRKAMIPANGIVDYLTKSEIRIWLTHGHTKNNPPPPINSNKPNIENGVSLITPRVPHFSQGNEQWGDKILGYRSTIKKRGCAITCIAMILKFYGRHVTPGTLDDYLDRSGGYDGDNVRWAVAGSYGKPSLDKLKYSNQEGSETALHNHLIERVNLNKPTMVRVDYGSDPGIIYNHFVVCVGVTDQNAIIMNDPATRVGDGYANLCDDNIIQKTTRKNGYRIVKLDWYDPVV